MREIIAFAVALVGPFVEVPVDVREHAQTLDDNLFSLGAATTLVVAIIMWVNI